MRRLMITLGLFLLTIPVSGNVILGEIDLRSYLNQPLEARIVAQGSSLSERLVEFQLATPEEFRRFGLQRSELPSDLEVIVEGVGAQRVIRLRTQRPVREPYLGILLEARWNGGRVLREYTLLLDPPVAFTPQASEPPVLSAPPSVVAPTFPVSVAPVPPPAAPTVTPVAAPEPHAAGGEYRVQRGDTLYSIVSRQGYRGVTSQQAMIAVLEANPGAFINGNINLLRAGAVLELPAQESISALEVERARREVQRQTEVWREASAAPAPTPPAAAPAPAPAPVPTTPEPEPTPLSALDPEPAAVEPVPADDALPEPDPEPDSAVAPAAEPPVDPESEWAADIDPIDRLEILGDPGLISGEGVPGGTQILEEAMISQQMAMADLRAELSSLRSELQQRDQQLAVVNNDLARLQERLGGLGQPADAASGAGAISTDIVSRLREDPILAGMAGGLAILLLLLLWSLRRAPRATESVALPTALDQAAVEKVRKSGAQKGSQATSAKSTAAAVGVGGAAGVAGAGTASTQEAKESAAGRAEADDMADDSTRPAPELTGMEAIREQMAEDGDDDPFADVDLYLAYGMHDQAVAALEREVDRGNDSPPYLTRLLEAYAGNDDIRSMRRVAALLRPRLSAEDDEWQERLAAVEARFPALKESDAKEFVAAPISEGAAPQAPPVAKEAAASRAAAGAEGSPTLADSSTAATPARSKLAPPLEPLPSLDMDFLSEPESPKLGAVAAADDKNTDAKSAELDPGSMEFTGFDFDLTSPEPATSKSEAEAVAKAPEDSNLMDFDLGDLGLMESESGSNSKPASTEKKGSMGQDSMSLDSMGKDSGGKDSIGHGADELDFSDLGLPDFDLDATPEKAKASSGAGDLIAPDSDTSEVGMKLSLAEAFLEMGDHDGAAALLGEITSDASPEQRAKAEALRLQIANRDQS